MDDSNQSQDTATEIRIIDIDIPFDSMMVLVFKLALVLFCFGLAGAVLFQGLEFIIGQLSAG